MRIPDNRPNIGCRITYAFYPLSDRHLGWALRGKIWGVIFRMRDEKGIEQNVQGEREGAGGHMDSWVIEQD